MTVRTRSGMLQSGATGSVFDPWIVLALSSSLYLATLSRKIPTNHIAAAITKTGVKVRAVVLDFWMSSLSSWRSPIIGEEGTSPKTWIATVDIARQCWVQ
ncbi:hypothetical protein C5167_014670 [Papaver somniferum]|uniref:Uncharacterized protein n=1 Tax=Papaver somniferum TaxID=3469 RepID=A0A4Y7J4U3_PAPSO|nr:hypothetical protein C5167_014670 [Papaver somniferum]